MITPPPFWAKLSHSFGSLDNPYQNLADIPVQRTENQHGSRFTDSVREYLRSRLAGLPLRSKTELNADLICNPALLLDFYVRREIRPVWVAGDRLNPKAEVFIETIARADQEGLDANAYHRDDIFTLLTDIEHSTFMDRARPAKFAELELLLTDALFSYGFNVSEGIVEPNSGNFGWYIEKPKKDIPKILQGALKDDRLEELVDRLQPRHSGYLRLKSALLKYQNIKKAGSWHTVPGGSKIRKGDAGQRVAALRLRLMGSNDLEDTQNGNPEYFDDALEDGVKRFQARHGLKVDGVVGFNTLSALNVSLEDRIQQIKLNMERWRWLPQDLGARYILVNTADFQVKVIENEQTLKTIRAIVGKKDRPTPMLSRKLTYLELNPYWNIPHKIALNDILPCIKKDPDYLMDKGIRIFENWTADAKELNPESIDWSGIGKDNFIYKLRQDPKSSNALGRVKFMFPNEFSIYLHDTPARELFDRTKRAFSSGCIRVEKPMELAAYLLSDNPKWDLQELIAAVDSKKTRAISLPAPINIHILYWTAWVDKDGITQFREDIYGRDRQLKIALNVKTMSPDVLYGKSSEKKYVSYRNLTESNPPSSPMNTFGTWVVNNAAIR
jgi:murein L,D-transpeptidase YcbB/YkuD